MSAIYDNWERLVAAVIKRQELWQLFHEQSRSPSVRSQASDLSSSSSLSTYCLQTEDVLAESQKAPSKLVLVSDFSPAFDAEHVFSASIDLLGRGTFGSTYAAVMESGVKFVVKRLNSVNIVKQDFKRHMEILGDVRHENVAALRAYYYSKEERLMLYDYYGGGSVFVLLHGNKGTAGRRALDWQSRLKIAVGAARGIAHIHRQDGGKLVHGNVKSSNIFLNAQHYGLVSDAGLAKVTTPVQRSLMQSPVYCAPEVEDTSNASQASDVYSFGFVLLELVSGWQLQHIKDDGKAILLVMWIQSLIPDKWNAVGVFDVELLRYQNEEESMWQLLQVAMDCVTNVPEHRPKMSQVVKRLEEISGIDTGEQSFTKSRLEDIQQSIESRLEDVVEDLLCRLTL